MAENEKTSHDVASIASRILKMDAPILITNKFWEEIKAVAASALTQAPDKPKLTLREAYNNSKSKKKLPDFSNLGKAIQDGFEKK